MDRNRDLFWELLEPEHPRVRAFCRRLAGDRDRGDDLCQEVLLAAWRRFQTLREPARFKAWLYRIVLNRHRNTCRSRFWRRFVPMEDAIGNGAGPDPGARLDARRILDLAMSALSADERALCTLFELEGWSLSDLAALTGKSENAIKVRLFRIRKRMRAALTKRFARMESAKQAITDVRKERLWTVTRPGID
jgi:RNA polymerase sigma-70 factor (ECF subfamily)